jgi:hypothetical protein
MAYLSRTIKSTAFIIQITLKKLQLTLESLLFRINSLQTKLKNGV